MIGLAERMKLRLQTETSEMARVVPGRRNRYIVRSIEGRNDVSASWENSGPTLSWTSSGPNGLSLGENARVTASHIAVFADESDPGSVLTMTARIGENPIVSNRWTVIPSPEWQQNGSQKTWSYAVTVPPIPSGRDLNGYVVGKDGKNILLVDTKGRPRAIPRPKPGEYGFNSNVYFNSILGKDGRVYVYTLPIAPSYIKEFGFSQSQRTIVRFAPVALDPVP